MLIVGGKVAVSRLLYQGLVLQQVLLGKYSVQTLSLLHMFVLIEDVDVASRLSVIRSGASDS